MDAQDVKLLNQLPLDNTDNDETFVKLIELYKPLADDYCNREFDSDNLPSGVEKFIADCIKYGSTGNIASRSMGTVSYSYVTDVPDAIYKPLKPYRRLSWSGKNV